MLKNSKLLRTIKLGIFFSFFIPLIVTHSTFFPFIFGKAIVFQVLVGILFVFWLALLARGEVRLNWSPLNIALLTYFAILGLSTLFSLDQLLSFWSSQERMTGFFNLLHLGAYFLIISTVFKKEDFKWLFRASLGASAIVSIVALVQGGDRLSGTLGNPGFLASYLLFNLFFAIYLFLEDKNIFWRFGLGAIFILDLAIFYLIKTRGAYLGLFIGLLFILIAKIWQSKGRKRFLMALIMIIVLLSSLGLFLREKERILESPGGRIIAWRISWEAFKVRPILGWGPENYILGFAKHFIPEFAMYEASWFDRAHNIAWEYLVGAGVLGFLAYVGVLIIASRKSLFVASIIIAYFVTNLFWIETTSSLMLFYAILAYGENI